MEERKARTLPGRILALAAMAIHIAGWWVLIAALVEAAGRDAFVEAPGIQPLAIVPG